MSDTTGKTRFLIVDDHPLVGASLARMLRQGGDVTFVKSGSEALEVLEAGLEVDVVLCDLMMPGMTGEQLYARLAVRFPALLAKVIFMTGSATTPGASAFLDVVPNPVLEKPFNREDLAAAIRALDKRAHWGLPAR